MVSWKIPWAYVWTYYISGFIFSINLHFAVYVGNIGVACPLLVYTPLVVFKAVLHALLVLTLYIYLFSYFLASGLSRVLECRVNRLKSITESEVVKCALKSMIGMASLIMKFVTYNLVLVLFGQSYLLTFLMFFETCSYNFCVCFTTFFLAGTKMMNYLLF